MLWPAATETGNNGKRDNRNAAPLMEIPVMLPVPLPVLVTFKAACPVVLIGVADTGIVPPGGSGTTF